MTVELLHAVESSIPASLRDNYSLFVDMIKLYYENLYLRSDTKKITELHRYVLADETLDGYINTLMKDMGMILPINDDIDNTSLVVYILNYILRSRGSESSIKAFFKLVFNEDVLISHPRKLLFKASNTQNNITATHLFRSTTKPLGLYYSFKGFSSNVESDIESLSYFLKDGFYYILVDAYTELELKANERIDMFGENQITCTNIGLYDCDVVYSGQYYKVGDVISFYDASVKGEFKVSSVGGGTVESVSIVSVGMGYNVGDIVMSSPNNGFFAKVTSVGVNGEVMSIDIKNNGRGFTELPDIYVNGSNGTGVTLKPITNGVGSIKTVTCLSPTILKNSDVYNIYSDYGIDAVLTLKHVQSVNNKRFINNDHKLGINSVIIDSNNFHEHSYNIISETDSILWREYFDKYFHRVGFVYNHINPITITSDYVSQYTSEVL